MEKFTGLPEEKQSKIIDGALASFSLNGYKKTSVSDIAVSAGISKAMVFHYFGTKKELYVYLIGYCTSLIMNQIEEKFDRSITDFFDRITMTAGIKISAMEKHPASLSFLSGVYFEQDPEVKQEIKAALATGESFRSSLAYDGIDLYKFKEGVDPKLVMKLLQRYTEGHINELPNHAAVDVEAINNEFQACIRLLKNNLYKEEYL
ncbi:TetR/AcrR family transcriptional regulator [Paenibacillus sp. DMB5]|uniref:TetR/AcrR family transcriptional regulator n=1 Tax=Paenibacillus sp. DMB5 TaxID=1780103 RepID=UPI00076CBE6C|nr:TetR/AcrR family transcriptional regulator [Paenibacillus sp. DMB5]KUP24037.1 transcriptional regulator [Paenibacillus sp. DMB5]